MSQEYLHALGSCAFWNVEPWLEAANILTAADEPLMALELLKLVPGYYRDNKPKEIIDLENKIYGKLVTPGWYSREPEFVCAEKESAFTCTHTLRGDMVKKEVEKFNKQGLTPHILEYAPGTYWLPVGLKALGLRFTYQSLTFGKSPYPDTKHIYGSPVIYCAFEVIEHLHHEEDIKSELLWSGLSADIMHISTPKYSYDGRMESLDWSEKSLGHIKTYTPMEFANVVTRMFPNYTYTLYPEQVMHLRGERHGNKFL